MRKFTTKREVPITDLTIMEPRLGILFYELLTYAKAYALSCVITSLYSDRQEDKAGPHKDGRGLDVSCRGWTGLLINRVKHYLNRKYGVEWGTRPVDQEIPPRVCVVHDTGSGLHFHLQVRSDIQQGYDL